jgi:hypothetical protein
MAAVDDVDELIEQYQLALDEFVKGNPEPVQNLFSHRDDATIANPYGPPVRGWEQVAQVTEQYVTAELAYVVQVERLQSKVGAREDITPYSLRATMIFRPEDGEWKVVHRHADQITTAQPAESVIQN